MKNKTHTVTSARRRGLILLCLLSSAASVLAQATITNIPGLGGSAYEIRALNSLGMAAGFSYLAGDSDQHAILFSGGVTYDLGGFFSVGSGINASGQVTGDSYTADFTGFHAFLFASTGNTDLGTLGGSLSTAAAINDSGQVVGTSYLTGDAGPVAFLYSGGHMTGLGTLGGSFSSAAAINAAGQVVGSSATNGDLAVQAFLFSAGVMTNLGTLGGVSSSAKFVNRLGQVAGDSDTTNSQTHAFFYNAGVMSDIGTFGGTSSGAYGMNDSGQVIGDADTTNDVATHAFVYSGGVLTDLGTLGGGFSTAGAINNQGQIVGATASADGTPLAFLWRNGTMTDLNTVLAPNSGWVLQTAELINDAGQIVGSGLFNGNSTWFLLSLPPAATNRPPVAKAGAAQTVQCSAMAMLDGSGSSDPDGDALSYDWSENSTPLASGVTAAVSLGVGSHTIVLTVTDSHGATAQDSVLVTVVDTVAPTITCPNSISVSANANCQAAVPDFLAGLIASDNCTPAAQLSKAQDPAAGTLVGIGSYLVTIAVSDLAGNSSACITSFTVADTTPPTVSCPPAVTASADANGQAAVPNFLASVIASDNCTPTAQLFATQSPAAGTKVGTGSYAITIKVADASGNASTCTATFTVMDTTAPVIRSVTASPNLLSPADGAFVPVTVTVAASDNCDPSPVSRIVSVTSSEPVTGPGDKTSPDWVITGNLTANLRAERQQKGNGRTYTITITCTDFCGNASTGTTTVNVPRR